MYAVICPCKERIHSRNKLHCRCPQGRRGRAPRRLFFFFFFLRATTERALFLTTSSRRSEGSPALSVLPPSKRPGFPASPRPALDARFAALLASLRPSGICPPRHPWYAPDRTEELPIAAPPPAAFPVLSIAFLPAAPAAAPADGPAPFATSCRYSLASCSWRSRCCSIMPMSFASCRSCCCSWRSCCCPIMPMSFDNCFSSSCGLVAALVLICYPTPDTNCIANPAGYNFAVAASTQRRREMTDFLATVMDQPHLTEKWPAFIDFCMTTKECIRKKCRQVDRNTMLADMNNRRMPRNIDNTRMHNSSQQPYCLQSSQSRLQPKAKYCWRRPPLQYCNGHCSYLSLRLPLHCPAFASTLPKSAKTSHVGMHFHKKKLPQKPMKQAAMHTTTHAHTPAHQSAMRIATIPTCFFCNSFWGIFWEVATNVCDQQVLWKVTFEIPTRYSEALTVLSNLTSERRGDYRALVIAMEKPTRFTPTGPGDCT